MMVGLLLASIEIGEKRSEFFVESTGILIKFIKKSRIEGFLDGNLYMNNSQYYIDLENSTGQSGQGDKLEGKIPIYSNTIKTSESETKITIHKEYGCNKFPIFCMMLLEPYQNDGVNGNFAFSSQQQYDEMKSFSDDCVVIKNPDEFIRRFTTACKKEKIIGCHEQVFYDKDALQKSKVLKIIEDNNLQSCFYKNEKFSLQQEYRFLVCKEFDKAFILNIGCIRDIAEICKTENFWRKPL